MLSFVLVASVYLFCGEKECDMVICVILLDIQHVYGKFLLKSTMVSNLCCSYAA